MANPFVILPTGTVGMIIKLLCTKHTCEAGKLLLAHFKKLIKKNKQVALLKKRQKERKVLNLRTASL